ncbi:MAG: hypothetical protein GQ574_10405 [Crocinitomix sp.]|nr:hypothetical protein [Crocinitomix sp.]
MKNTKSTIKMMILAGALVAILPACKKKGCTDPDATNYSSEAKKDDGSCEYDTSLEWYTDVTIGGIVYKQVTGHITEAHTMTAADNWLLSGGVFVDNGVTLTIEAGTTVNTADDGTTPFLSVQQGGTISACGTADSPIIFTPVADAPSAGAWGGIILNGFAPINTGLTAEGEGGTGTYGGDNAEDNSGMLCYVRVEFAGKILGTDNELNGFSFNGCGSGTTLHHLQAYKGSDDGFEFFGGTVSLKYAISSGNQDDSFDWTHGWSGNGQFWVVQQDTDGGDRGIEADNNGDNNEASPYSDPKIANVTLIGMDDGDAINQGIKLREGTKGNFLNFIITGFPKRGCQVEHDVTLSNMVGGSLTMQNSIIDNVDPLVFTTSAGDDATGMVTFEDGANNNATATDGSLVGFLTGYVGTTATGAGDPTAWGTWFDNANYIGAVSSGSDWTAGWTLGL